MFQRIMLPIIGCLLIFLSSTAMASPSPDKKIKLRFKQTGSKSLKLTVSRKTEIYETSWERERDQTIYEGTNVFAYRIKEVQGDNLQVRARLYSSDKSVNSKVLQEGKPEDAAGSSFLINSRGVRAQRSNNESSELDLQFPEEPVGAGDRWKVTVPPSENFPAPIVMNFQISKFVKKGSTTYCIINSNYETSAFFTERGCRAKLESKNRIIFDVSKGYIKRQSGSSTFITTWLKKGEENPLQSARFATMKLIIK